MGKPRETAYSKEKPAEKPVMCKAALIIKRKAPEIEYENQ